MYLTLAGPLLFCVLIPYHSVSILKIFSQFISDATITAQSKPWYLDRSEHLILWEVVNDGKHSSYRWEFDVVRVRIAQTNISPLVEVLGSVPYNAFDFRSICYYSGTCISNRKWIHCLDVLQVSFQSKINFFFCCRESQENGYTEYKCLDKSCKD